VVRPQGARHRVLRASIAGNIGQIAHLTKLADSSDRLEVVSRSDLNIVCFPYVWPGATADELNRVNQAVLTRLQVGGLAIPSHTVIDGKFVIRVANNNHRSERSDFAFLVEQVVAIGDELVAT
jgi:glutamate/tyrosine decarboxylase-like PLP-dependent enzyme